MRFVPRKAQSTRGGRNPHDRSCERLPPMVHSLMEHSLMSIPRRIVIHPTNPNLLRRHLPNESSTLASLALPREEPTLPRALPAALRTLQKDPSAVAFPTRMPEEPTLLRALSSALRTLDRRHDRTHAVLLEPDRLVSNSPPLCSTGQDRRQREQPAGPFRPPTGPPRTPRAK
jgi:hypothetical protein